MRIWIDVREACKPRKTGKGQWAMRCVEALLRRGDVHATLVSDVDIPGEWKILPGFQRLRVIPTAGLRWHWNVARLLRDYRQEIDVYLSPTSFIVPFLVGRSVPVVPVVHDLIAFRNEPHDRKATLIERFTLGRAVRTAKNVYCVSKATAQLVRERFGLGLLVTVVGAGPTVDEEQTWIGDGDHLLCIGTLCPRKNQLRLMQAYAALTSEQRDGATLILIGGRGWSDDEIVRMAKETEGVTWMGFQDAETCAQVLRTCRAFVWVSEEEGFGLPVLDAMRVGAPVLVSSIPSLQEVAGDAAVYADPFDVASITAGLTMVLTTDSSVMRARGTERATLFSWEKTAAAVAQACVSPLSL